MIEVYKNIYLKELPLPDNPLKALNLYIIKGRDKSMIIDTGFNREDTKKELIQVFDELDIRFEDTILYLTHYHSDHAGLAHFFQEKGCEIYISDVDGNMINNSMSKDDKVWINAIKNAKLQGLKEDSLDLENHPGFRYRPKEFINYKSAVFGEHIQIGDYDFEIIDLSGHTPGITGLYEENHKILFCGDHPAPGTRGSTGRRRRIPAHSRPGAAPRTAYRLKECRPARSGRAQERSPHMSHRRRRPHPAPGSARRSRTRRPRRDRGAPPGRPRPSLERQEAPSDPPGGSIPPSGIPYGSRRGRAAAPSSIRAATAPAFAPLEEADVLAAATRMRDKLAAMGVTTHISTGSRGPELRGTGTYHGMILHMGNTAYELANHDRQTWDEVIDARVEQIRSAIQLKTSPLTSRAEWRTAIRVRLIDIHPYLPEVTPVTRPFAGNLMQALYRRWNGGVSPIDARDLEGCPFTVEELFEIGQRNTDDEGVVHRGPIGGGTWALYGEGFFTASKAANLASVLRDCPVETGAGAVFAVPHKHALGFHPVDRSDPEKALRAMALFVLDETVQHVDPLLSAFLYYRSPDGVVEVIGMPTGTSLDGTCMVTTVPAERFDDLLEEAGALPLDEALTRHAWRTGLDDEPWW